MNDSIKSQVQLNITSLLALTHAPLHIHRVRVLMDPTTLLGFEPSLDLSEIPTHITTMLQIENCRTSLLQPLLHLQP